MHIHQHITIENYINAVAKDFATMHPCRMRLANISKKLNYLRNCKLHFNFSLKLYLLICYNLHLIRSSDIIWYILYLETSHNTF